MRLSLPALAPVLTWVGTPYADLSCWGLVQRAYRTQGIELPDDYYASLHLFRVVTEPLPWDVLAIRNHPFVTNHCGLYVADGDFIHTLETTGCALSRVDRRPWSERIAGFLRIRS